MKECIFTIKENKEIAKNIFSLTLTGDVSEINKPGQFVNIKIDECFLRRPLSVCDSYDNTLQVVYRSVGKGTSILSKKKVGESLSILTGLGNGFDVSKAGSHPLLIAGGSGVPALYNLGKHLISNNCNVTAAFGFNTEQDIILIDEFKNLGINVLVSTVDGSFGTKGFVTDLLNNIEYSHFYTCGPEAMMKAVYEKTITDGQFSFEKRMGCGFGACMGCTCKTITGNKKICKDGPVLMKGDLIWED